MPCHPALHIVLLASRMLEISHTLHTNARRRRDELCNTSYCRRCCRVHGRDVGVVADKGEKFDSTKEPRVTHISTHNVWQCRSQSTCEFSRVQLASPLCGLNLCWPSWEDGDWTWGIFPPSFCVVSFARPCACLLPANSHEKRPKRRREMTNVIRKVIPAVVATSAGWTRREGERNSQILKFAQQQRGYDDDDDVMLLLCIVRFCGWFYGSSRAFVPN